MVVARAAVALGALLLLHALYAVTKCERSTGWLTPSMHAEVWASCFAACGGGSRAYAPGDSW